MEYRELPRILIFLDRRDQYFGFSETTKALKNRLSTLKTIQVSFATTQIRTSLCIKVILISGVSGENWIAQFFFCRTRLAHFYFEFFLGAND